MRTRLAVLLAAITLALVAPFVPAASAASPACSTPWGSVAESGNGLAMSQANVTTVRTGQHACYDRVVFDVAAGSVAGWRVQYVDTIRGIATGDPIPVAGGARLQVTMLHPAVVHLGMPNVVGYPTLRQLVYAGSFEGVTEVGVGVRARLPFRVFTLPGRLVLDVAHRW